MQRQDPLDRRDGDRRGDHKKSRRGGVGETAAKIRTRDGVELFHREWGGGKPVLFVHAWALSSAMWTYQIADLGQRGLRCIAFDRRGHGRSDVPNGGYDLDTLADDLAEVIEQLDLHDVALVGMSMGVERDPALSRPARHRRASRGSPCSAPTTPFVLQDGRQSLRRAAGIFRAELWRTWASDFPKWIEDNKLPFFTPGDLCRR